MQGNTCLFCGTPNVVFEPHYSPDYMFVMCPVCGRYSYFMSSYRDILNMPKDIVAAYLHHNIQLRRKEHDPSFTCLIGTETQMNALQNRNPYYFHATFEDMQAFYPASISDRVDKILLSVKRLTEYLGQPIQFTTEGSKSLLFLRRFDDNGNRLNNTAINNQYYQIRDYLVNQQYAKMNISGNGMFYIQLQTKGYEYAEELERHQQEAKPASASVITSANALKEVFSNEYLSKQIDVMMEAQENNPTDAIGKAKEIIESCCKTILERRSITWSSDDNVVQLVGETMHALGIHSKDIQGSSEVDIITKAMLSNLQQIAQRIAEMRNIGGSGHGKPASFQPLSPKYARLAVSSSIALVKFLWDTHEESKTLSQKKS